ncbi:MAG: glutathione S-transferase family protein [Gammaproteobacteria bacterium]
MRFYDYRSAPSPRKVRLFIAEKGLDVPTVEVDLRARAHQDPSFLAKNAGATVPVLELDDGTCLTESLAICHYLEQQQPEPNLMGNSAREQAHVLMWNDILTLEGYLPLQESLRNSHEAFKGRALPGPVAWEQIPALAERGRRRAVVFFDKLETRLRESEFVAGERFTYADIVAFVYLGFAPRATDTNPIDGRRALKQWSEAIAARPAIERAG